MTRLPILKAEQAIKALEKASFVSVRQRGGHIRLKHGNGRVRTVPWSAGHQLLARHAGQQPVRLFLGPLQHRRDR
jgi:predicted RNA binding protein YcfA (HicA-like mRNA interferase family)